MSDFPQHLAEIETRFDNAGTARIREPGEDGYDEIRAALIQGSRSQADLDRIYARYPKHDITVEELELPHDEPRAAAIKAATSEEELDKAYEAHPLQRSPQDLEYEKAVREATSTEELDEVYERFGKTKAFSE